MSWFAWSPGLIPILLIFYQFGLYGEGPNPVEFVLHLTGLWGLGFLLGSLSVRPLMQLGRWKKLFPLKKVLGLLGFFYGAIHSLIYIALDQSWDWIELSDDFTKRIHIRFGMLALVLLVPLALTSNTWSQKRLGRNWRRLHSLFYVAACLLGLHYMLARKTGYQEASWALALVVLLLLLRCTPILQKIRSLFATASCKK